MALETRIPKEINDYREKIVFGMSGRQLIAVALAAAVVVPTALLLWYVLHVNFSIVEYILILEALPFAAWGFVRHKGMPFEQVALIRMRHRFGCKRLLNKTDLDGLPSLYPMRPSDIRAKGGNREQATRKERKARRRQRECLDAGEKSRRRRPHPEEEKQGAAEGREEARA